MKKNTAKTAIITGGSSGIGFAIAKKIAKNNINTIIVSKTLNKIKRAQQIISEEGWKRVFPYAVDVRKKEEVDKFATEVKKRFKRLDYLINSAGVSIHGQFDKIIDTNLKGIFLCCKVFWNLLKHSKGQIVTISSASGINAYPTGSIYCASKFGTNGLMESLAEEGREKGIKVILICPGQVNTPIWPKSDPVINKAKTGMLKPKAIADLVWYILNRPHNEHIRKIVIHPFKLQPNLRGRNKGPNKKAFRI